VYISGVSPSGATAVILVDGVVKANQTFPVNTTGVSLSVQLSPGTHNITVNSSGSDWYKVCIYLSFVVCYQMLILC
jgi:hypothetical protein